MCVPRFLLSFAAESTDPGATALWSNQQNVDLTAQENPVTWLVHPQVSVPCQFSQPGWSVACNELKLFFLPSSGLKSPEEEFCQVACSSQREKGLLEFGAAKAARPGPAGLFLLCLPSPVQAFCLMWAFLQNSVQNSVCLGLSDVTWRRNRWTTV